LLDTNVVSEFIRPRPDPRVLEWLNQLQFSTAHLSVATLSEIRMGIERLPHGRRREALEDWLAEELLPQFGSRLLVIDEAVAERCGVIRSRAYDSGKPIAVMDAFLAATADIHGLTLVTRNVKDFAAWGGPILNPWSD
jgi:predicted nucleic acid-binding protein